MKTLAAAVPRHGPFRPADWQRQQEQRADVRNHERAAAVRRGLAGEAKEISQPDRGTRDREDDADPAAPDHFLFLSPFMRAC